MAKEDNKKNPTLSNILNQKEGADPNLDVRIKRGAIWWPAVTFFYLWSNLKIKTSDSFLGFPLENMAEDKLLKALLLINVIFWLRLVWRIGVSWLYNRAHSKFFLEISNPQKDYQKRTKLLRVIDKYIIGLGVPFTMGIGAIICLICVIWI